MLGTFHWRNNYAASDSASYAVIAKSKWRPLEANTAIGFQRMIENSATHSFGVRK